MAQLDILSINVGMDPSRPPLDPIALRIACEAALAAPDRRAQAADAVTEALRASLNERIGVIDSRLFDEVY